MNLFLSLSHRTLKFSPMTFHQAAWDAPKSAAGGSGNALIPYLDRTISDNDALWLLGGGLLELRISFAIYYAS